MSLMIPENVVRQVGSSVGLVIFGPWATIQRASVRCGLSAVGKVITDLVCLLEILYKLPAKQ